MRAASNAGTKTTLAGQRLVCLLRVGLGDGASAKVVQKIRLVGGHDVRIGVVTSGVSASRQAC